MPRRILPAALLAFAAATLAGCGGGQTRHPVSGTVTLDNSPIEGATVVFVSDDGKQTFAGQTDASGKYSLSAQGKEGAFAGNYKVLITKGKAMTGDATAGSADYTKQMAKISKETASKDTGPGPAMPPSSPAAAAAAGGRLKGDLPGLYATATTTPFSGTVPASGPLDFALKSDAKIDPKKK